MSVFDSDGWRSVSENAKKKKHYAKMLTPIRSKDLFSSKLSVYEIFVGASPFLLVLHIFHTKWLMKSSFKSKQLLPLFWMSIFSPLFFSAISDTLRQPSESKTLLPSVVNVFLHFKVSRHHLASVILCTEPAGWASPLSPTTWHDRPPEFSAFYNELKGRIRTHCSQIWNRNKIID